MLMVASICRSSFKKLCPGRVNSMNATFECERELTRSQNRRTNFLPFMDGLSHETSDLLPRNVSHMRRTLRTKAVSIVMPDCFKQRSLNLETWGKK